MFDFNKRDPAGKPEEAPVRDEPASAAPAPAAQPTRRSSQEAAVIGPSIHIEGNLHGEEDLIIEGEVKGTVQLKHHSLTIGTKGKVTANVYANAIIVDGFMCGDLYAAERVTIRKSAQVEGNISSPRVSLEDGAGFKGSIEMDPESEALKSAFGERRSGRGPEVVPAPRPAPAAASPAPSTAAQKTDRPAAAAARGGSAG
jgi:cytoskeletal protein CcmA (bactofilin family)